MLRNRNSGIIPCVPKNRSSTSLRYIAITNASTKGCSKCWHQYQIMAIGSTIVSNMKPIVSKIFDVAEKRRLSHRTGKPKRPVRSKMPTALLLLKSATGHRPSLHSGAP